MEFIPDREYVHQETHDRYKKKLNFIPGRELGNCNYQRQFQSLVVPTMNLFCGN